MQLLPRDIRALPAYSVPAELFICSSIFLGVLLVGLLVVVVTWVYRSCKHIYNYEYIADHEFMVYYKNKEEKLRGEDPDDNLPSEDSNSQSRFSLSAEGKTREFNRNQSRMLEFATMSVVAVINFNAFACNAFLLITYFLAFLCYMVFNVFRKFEDKEYPRLLYFVPLLAAHLPFFIESKALLTA